MVGGEEMEYEESNRNKGQENKQEQQRCELEEQKGKQIRDGRNKEERYRGQRSKTSKGKVEEEKGFFEEFPNIPVREADLEMNCLSAPRQQNDCS